MIGLHRWLPFFLVLSGLTGAAVPAEERPVVRVGVVYDGTVPDEHDVLLQTRRAAYLDQIVAETQALLRREFDVRFPEEKRFDGNWTVKGIRDAIRQLLDDPEVDLVVSLAPMATHELARMESPPKPVIGVWALDVDAQHLPFDGNATGVHNLNYLIASGSILRDLSKFRDVVRFERVHILTDRRFVEAIPEVPQKVITVGARLGVEVELVPVDTDAGAALAAIPEDAQAVYITPLLRMSVAELDRLLEGIHGRKIPTFSLLGEIEVRRGVLAGMRTEADLPRVSRRIALNIQRILAGEDAGQLPVLLGQPERLMINMATARSIGFYPRWRVLIEARQINPDALQAGPPLSIETAVAQAVASNLALQAGREGVAAEAENVARARAAFVPQLGLSARGVQIDADRAAASFGSQAEKTLSAGTTATWLLYSDGALANVSISKSLLRSAEQQLEAERLDLARDAAIAYLNVLRAETLERVERDNLQLTESNLDVARRRERLGISGSADVYRWESALAVQRSSLIAADNRVAATKIVVNALRNRPLEDPFSTVPTGLEEPWLITVGDRMRPYTDDPVRFRWLREFYVQQGLRNSVELQALEAGIVARERALAAARRRNRLPSVALQGEWESTVERSGDGSEGPALPSSSPLFGLFPESDDETWSLALSATLPLFEGGERLAEVRQARRELARLRLERAALIENIETRIRAAMFEAGSSFPAIELAEEAAEAARKNLDLVTDAYSRGAVSIIDLVDAQNAALAADGAAANAVFEFLIDLMEAQRASNTLDFFLSDEQRESFFDAMHSFFEAGGLAPGR